ncbi:hypothetical protein E2C01_000648 [Portunus trituberculatus]|uniref:Uncharacterized protein n=1 Tax=Portunus trituberculatus TaxID=210409 RepID=A0A5B7CFL8_PORTR|nr:hypothetical protein [Portunus trituberculatus]
MVLKRLIRMLFFTYLIVLLTISVPRQIFYLDFECD